jgi:epoxyqueuosine reductase QueG
MGGYRETIDSICLGQGALKTGVADLGPFRDEASVPEDLLVPYTRALSIAIRLPDEVIEGITERPTNDYAHTYWKVNDLLNRTAFEASMLIEREGFRAKPIPASHFADEPRLLGNISHKAVARMAGLGWQGKSLLLVTPEHGPRVRLVTVLTDMPLDPDGPVKNRCGECTECTEACPVGAVRGVLPEGEHFKSREEAVDIRACYARTKENKARPGIGALVCGACIRACPWGKEKKDGSQ